MNEPKVSVIVPVRNGADEIEQCLKAIFSQSLMPYEVIVVDGHSTDGTVQRAQKYPVKITYEDYGTRGGACQKGIEKANGEYVAFTDADCIPDSNWLANLVREFDDGIVGVGGQVIYTGNSFWERAISLAFATFVGSANSIEGRLFQKRRFVNSISGCNSIYRRQDILDIGGFNPYFISEDTELNKRLVKKGKFLHIPTAVVAHEQEESLKGFARRIHKWGRTRVITRKWDLQVIPPLIVPLLLISLIFTPWIFLAAIGLYAVITLIMGIKFTLQEKDARYLFSIPIVYIVEHSSYTAGFWREVLWPHKKLKDSAKLN